MMMVVVLLLILVFFFLLKAIHMETDPQTISAYLIYLSQHAPVEEQSLHNDLALVSSEHTDQKESWDCEF